MGLPSEIVTPLRLRSTRGGGFMSIEDVSDKVGDPNPTVEEELVALPFP